MPLTPDLKLKLAAAVYGHFVTNQEVGNNQELNSAYLPKFEGEEGHTKWIEKLLSGNTPDIKEALSAIDIPPSEHQKVIDVLPKGGDNGVAVAVYTKLRDDFAKLHAAGHQSSHDY